MVKTAQQYQIGLYRSLFKTRDDVFARFWEDLPQKKSGYAPVYRLNQSPEALTDTAILTHFEGDQTLGVILYIQTIPLLS